MHMLECASYFSMFLYPFESSLVDLNDPLKKLFVNVFIRREDHPAAIESLV